ncbi:hypothetical protein [Paracoccus suum]|uniref:hypothetical protein n=1 Tax=Paracoccus suum TaxID=2259340 RepID=UPI001F541A60|nr:hypothetical protein [Paracoccus suum]
MAGFGGGLMQGALLCGATLAALSLALPQPTLTEAAAVAPRVTGEMPKGPPRDETPPVPAAAGMALTAPAGASTAPPSQAIDRPLPGAAGPVAEPAAPAAIGEALDRAPTAPGSLAANPPRPVPGRPLPAPRGETLPQRAVAEADSRPAPMDEPSQEGLPAATGSAPALPQTPRSDAPAIQQAALSPLSTPAGERAPVIIASPSPQTAGAESREVGAAPPAARMPDALPAAVNERPPQTQNSAAGQGNNASDAVPAVTGDPASSTPVTNTAPETPPTWTDNTQMAVAEAPVQPAAIAPAAQASPLTIPQRAISPAAPHKTYPAPDLALPPDLPALLEPRQMP